MHGWLVGGINPLKEWSFGSCTPNTKRTIYLFRPSQFHFFCRQEVRSRVSHTKRSLRNPVALQSLTGSLRGVRVLRSDRGHPCVVVRSLHGDPVAARGLGEGLAVGDEVLLKMRQPLGGKRLHGHGTCYENQKGPFRYACRFIVTINIIILSMYKYIVHLVLAITEKRVQVR